MRWLKKVLISGWITSWSAIFRLIFGREWFTRYREYKSFIFARRLLEILFTGYVRRVGEIAQFKLPNGMIALLPFESNMGLAVREIFIDQVYDGFHKPRNNDIVIDIGAHVGLFSIKICRNVNKVISVEPHPSNYKLLLMNLQLNKIGNILPVKSAVSNYSGEAKLYTLNGSLSYTIKSLPKNVISAKMKSIIVKVKTLDRLIDEIGLNKVNFIKIDCEGAELDVLEGAERILSNNDLFLTIAAYHYPGEIFEIAKFLSAKGMRVFSNGAYVYAFK